MFLEEFPEDLKSNLESASELWLVGVSLHRTINFNYATLERKLRQGHRPVSYTHLRAHETVLDLVCRLLLEKKKNQQKHSK